MTKKILIVEDDLGISDAIRELLTYEGFHVDQAFNGREAIDFLKLGNHPDIIILDLMMPILDGVGFRLEQLKDPLISPIPVIVMSADGNIRSKAEMIKVDTYLKKPIDIDHLIEKMNLISSHA